MKKHLVLIVGNFYPNPSPTGKCAEGYLKLLQNQFEISVVCLADTDRTPYTHNQMRVFPAAGGYTLFLHRIRKKLPKIFQKLLKIPVHLRHCFTQPNNLYSYVKAAKKTLHSIHREHPVDVIFSAAAPMAAHVAARDFCKLYPEVRWVSYTVDSYAVQNKNSRRYSKALSFESSVLSAAHHVLLSEEIYDNNPSLYATFSNKCTPLPYLMPERHKQSESTQYFDPEKINLVYAGRFYKDIRNPEYLLRMALEMDDNCVLHLFCQSDCDSLINDYVSRSVGKIRRHATVGVAEIQQIYLQSDVLVNVGNNLSEFKPSKTFEYIASGKPILNIYYEGQFDRVLAKNPITLQICRDCPIPEATAALCNFLKSTQCKTLSCETIDSLYPEHSKENIRRILTEICL